MQRQPSTKLIRMESRKAAAIGVGLLIGLPFAAVLTCSCLGIRSEMDVIGYCTMVRKDYHPIWKDLAWRQIKKGDSLESLLQRHSLFEHKDYGAYTVLRYNDGELIVWAKEGRLIEAKAGGDGWEHTFFATPSEERPRSEACSAYMRQKTLEHQVLQIHRVITAGQDVFLGWAIERHEVPGHSYDPQMMAELEAIYGRDYLVASGMMTAHELIIEVMTVLHGDLQPGMILTIPNGQCGHIQPGDSDVVFLHVDDQRLLYNPQYPAEESYTTLPREALDWYQSLTAEQVKDLEGRCLAERAELLKQ